MYPNFMNYQNTLPPQQILQANGKASIDALRMSPNSSVLIADQTQPIVWRCAQNSHIYLSGMVAAAPDLSPGAVGLERPYEYVGRVYGVGESGRSAVVIICQSDSYVHFALWPRHLETVLETLGHVRGFLGTLPLLEKGGKRLAVKHFSAFRIQHFDAAVSGKKQTVQVAAASCPTGGAVGSEPGDGGSRGVAGEDIVETQGGVGETVGEGACKRKKAHEQSREYADCSFHCFTEERFRIPGCRQPCGLPGSPAPPLERGRRKSRSGVRARLLQEDGGTSRVRSASTR